MKIRKLIFLAIFPLVIWAQGYAGLFDDRFPSARATAMGGAQTAIANDVWAGFYNPAGLVRLEEEYNLGGSYYKPFGASFFQAIFGSYAMKLPMDLGSASVYFQNFGVNYENSDLSQESIVGFSHGFYLLNDIHTSLSMGYSLKGYYWRLGSSLDGVDLGSQMVFGLDLAMQANIYRRTWIGFYALNINNPKIGEINKYDLPRRFTIGLGYQPFAGVTTTIDFNQVDGEELQTMMGVEYFLVDELALRFGVASEPNIFTAGLGLNIYGINFDYAFKSHPVLDNTHYFTLAYGF